MLNTRNTKLRRSTAVAAGAAIGLSSLALVGGAKGAPVVTTAPTAPPRVTVPAPLQSDPNIYVNLANQVMPAVVNISTLKMSRGDSRGLTPEDMFRYFFEGPNGPDHPLFRGPSGGVRRGYRKNPSPAVPRPYSLGTGFVVDSSGLVLTNYHVIHGADEIKLTFTEDPGEVPTDGEVIGSDPALDVALIRVKTKKPLQALPLGDSEALRVGEYVAAVGNPFGQGHSISSGIISAKGRPIPDLPLATYLQTDAPINPGNSGGPLVNLKGEVIGINTAIDARAQGIGFAIPVNEVKKILPQLKDSGSVARGYLGVMVGDLNPQLAGQMGVSEDLKAPLVTEVQPGTPAAKAGLKPYDVIVEVNGLPVRSSSELTRSVASELAGDSVELKILRDGKEKKLEVKLGTRPTSEQLAGYRGGDRGRDR